MYLPLFPKDLIQREIVTKGNFFECDQLLQLNAVIPPQAVILDIGANIGNHAIYWATQLSARKVYAFEPVPETFRILERNVQLNGLEKNVVILQLAVGDSNRSLTIATRPEDNIGGTELRRAENGRIQSITLDSFVVPEGKVDFLKIDVEKFECKVLSAAGEFLARYRPKAIFVEVVNENVLCVKQWMKKYRYTMARYFGYFNYLFVADS
jgi:FkbM family methyltransferase